jgi:hypothetical protein
VCPCRPPGPGAAIAPRAHRSRLEEIITNLNARLTEAHERGWLGEAEGIEVSIAGAQEKLARMSRLVSLGIPTVRTNGVSP